MIWLSLLATLSGIAGQESSGDFENVTVVVDPSCTDRFVDCERIGRNEKACSPISKFSTYCCATCRKNFDGSSDGMENGEPTIVSSEDNDDDAQMKTVFQGHLFGKVSSDENDDLHVDFKVNFTQNTLRKLVNIEQNKVVFSSVKLPYDAAKAVCELLGGVLPLPKTSQENEVVAEILRKNSFTSTWLGTSITDATGLAFQNFKENLMPLLTSHGGWSLTNKAYKEHFICVRERKKQCPNISDVFSSLNGYLQVLFKDDSSWQSDEIDSFDSFSEGDVFRYSCRSKIRKYKPWRKQSDSIQLLCTEINKERFDWVECNDDYCTSFIRYPWLDETMMKPESIQTMMCNKPY